MKLDLSFWKNASQRRKKIYLIIAVFVVAFMVTVIGSFVPISAQDAYTISNNLNQTLNENRANNNLVTYILLNNFSICLLMFIPIEPQSNTKRKQSQQQLSYIHPTKQLRYLSINVYTNSWSCIGNVYTL